MLYSLLISLIFKFNGFGISPGLLGIDYEQSSISWCYFVIQFGVLGITYSYKINEKNISTVCRSLIENEMLTVSCVFSVKL